MTCDHFSYFPIVFYISQIRQCVLYIDGHRYNRRDTQRMKNVSGAFPFLFFKERDCNVTARRSRSIRLWHRPSISRVRRASASAVYAHRQEILNSRISHARDSHCFVRKVTLDFAPRYGTSR